MAGRIAGQGSKWIRPEKRQRIYSRDGHTCQYCGRHESECGALTLDHVVAVVDGGDNSAANLVTCCGRCNSSKQDTPVAVFLRRLEAAGIADAAEAGRRVRNARRRKLPEAAR